MLDAILVMVLGMGGVFIFLVGLCLIMQAITKLLPAAPAPSRAATPAAQTGPGNGVPPDVVAAIQGAIVAYEHDRRS